MKNKQPPLVRDLQKTLNAITRAIHAYHDLAAYYFGYDGRQQHVTRWDKTRWRKKAKITRALNAAMRNAQAIGDPTLAAAIHSIKTLTRNVLEHCRFFPNGGGLDTREWRGAHTLAMLDVEIMNAKSILRALLGKL